MARKCIFCQIVTGELSSDIVYQDEDFVAFRDISPQAPVHVLIIPKTHISSVAELAEKQQGLVGRLIMVAKSLAEKQGLADKGYRLVMNCGSEGGQAVPHLHLHLLGGRRLDDRLG
jgi:histidine triad (HIT) family protein